MNTFDILNQWVEFWETDMDAGNCNAASPVGELYRKNKLAMSITSKYDTSGLLGILYIKYALGETLRHVTVNFVDLFKDFDKYETMKDLWDVFDSDEVKDRERPFINLMNSTITSLTGIKLFPDDASKEDKEAVFSSISGILEDMENLSVEMYQTGEDIDVISNFCTTIQVFEHLSDCLIALEEAQDGMYLCFISHYGKPDGYFGYFIKSRGNLFSLNERAKEVYEGQNQGRAYPGNDRLFPYDAVTRYRSKEDGVEYLPRHVIDREHLSFSKLSPEMLRTVVISMWLIRQRYMWYLVPEYMPLVLVNSLFPMNLEATISDSVELERCKSFPLVKAHAEFRANLSMDKFMSGAYNDEFSTGSEQYGECGMFTQNGQVFVDTYGDGFTFSEFDALSTHAARAALSCPASHVPPRKLLAAVPSELIGTARHMRVHAYYQLRCRLADYIEFRQQADYEAFGGREALVKWYLDKVTGKREHVLQLFANALKNDSKGMPVNVAGNSDPFYQLYLAHASIRMYSWKDGDVLLLNDQGDSGIRCPYTGTKCSEFLVFRPYNWQSIESLIQEEVPKFLKGWCRDYPYNGNSKLDMTDPVADVGTPVDSHRDTQHTSFYVVVGFSKRGFDRFMKEYKKKE